HPTASAAGGGLAADLDQIHARGVEVEIEMEIDIDIVAGRELENPRDLSIGIAVGIRAAADQVGALVQRLDEQRISARVVQQALLRKHADLDVDRPRVVPLELPDRLEASQPGARIDIDMGAHPRRSLDDRLLEGASAASVDVLDREAPLQVGNLPDRLFERVGVTAPLDQVGLVEMNMGLDET